MGKWTPAHLDFAVDHVLEQLDGEPEDVYQARVTPPARFRAVIDGLGMPCHGGGEIHPCSMLAELDLAELQRTLAAFRRWQIRYRGSVLTGGRVPARLHRLVLRCRNGHEDVWCAEPVVLLPPEPPLPEPVEIPEEDRLLMRRAVGRPRNSDKVARAHRATDPSRTRGSSLGVANAALLVALADLVSDGD